MLLASCSPSSVQTAVAPSTAETVTEAPTATLTPAPTPSPTPLNSLSISYLRELKYPGSDITIEQALTPGSNYSRYIVSYRSDGLNIHALMTVPKSAKPKTGFPVIIFNHGYIPPEQYRTTERYVAYVDNLARAGYLVFKPDYRGFGNSEGKPEGAYYSSAYAVDVLNALSSIKKYPEANAAKIGMWGHSMGGNISLRDLVVDIKDIKASVIWSGVVGSYDQLLNQWHRASPWTPSEREIAGHVTSIRQNLVNQYGTPQTNPNFWQSIDPTYYLADVTTPIQLHTGGNDQEVPPAFSVSLYDKLKGLRKTVEYYNYPGGDHNISSPNFELAMERTITFFDKYLKP